MNNPDRIFNQGTNALPQSNGKQNQFPFDFVLKTGETAATPYSVYEIDSFDDETGTWTLKRPTENNIPAGRLMFSYGKNAAGKYSQCGQQGAFWVAVEDDGNEPEVGDWMGTQEDSYKMTMYKFGFVCLKFDSENFLALVKECEFMPLLVKATSDESSGEVDVKFADKDGSVYLDAFTVYTVSNE